jgi:DNA-binding FadR family transcriptional regulator
LFEPLKTKRTFELIVDQLKEKIFSGEYSPGDRLPSERLLAESLKVSRNAIREAYRALELSGIVDIKKGSEGGAFIRKPTHKSISESLSDLLRLKDLSLSDLTEARLLLEKDIAYLAVQRLQTGDLDILKGLIDKSFAKLDIGVLATDENVNFHISLADISRNPILIMAFSSVMNLLRLFLKNLPSDLDTSRHVAEDHYRIIEELELRNFERLWEVLDLHIKIANERLMALESQSLG